MIELALFLKWLRSGGFFGESLGHVITLCGQILVSSTGGDFLFFLSFLSFFACVCVVCWRREEEGVCTFQTSPCAPSNLAQWALSHSPATGLARNISTQRAENVAAEVRRRVISAAGLRGDAAGALLAGLYGYLETSDCICVWEVIGGTSLFRRCFPSSGKGPCSCTRRGMRLLTTRLTSCADGSQSS